MTRLSRWGVGPRIVLSSVVYALLGGAATYVWPDECLLRWVPYAFFLTAGSLLLLIGIPMWLTAAVSVMRAYNQDQLRTSGICALCRHPIYSAWILFLLPALAILTRSWPLMLAPLVAYATFKSLIHFEDDYLRQRFGSAYLAYRSRVHEIIPIPKFTTPVR